MRRVIIRTALKGTIILTGILLISTGVQLLIRFQGAEAIISVIGGQISAAYPGQNEVLRKQAVGYIHEVMGINKPFVPDLWPFDNESLWHKPEPEQVD